jgi:hypothetical protein
MMYLVGEFTLTMYERIERTITSSDLLSAVSYNQNVLTDVVESNCCVLNCHTAGYYND